MRARIWLVLLWAAVAAVADDAKPVAEKRVLFICTGNFYRSRFAEALFNHKAQQSHLRWKAFSRGLRLEPGRGGVSPIAAQELAKRGVPAELCQGDPQSLTEEDFKRADYVVVMDETEHRPMLEAVYPQYARRKAHYWHIGDTYQMKVPVACESMMKNIETLIQDLAEPPAK